MTIVLYKNTKFLKRFNDNKRLLDRSQNFKLIVRKKICEMLPKSWKKLLNNGIVTTTKMRFCNECSRKIIR